MVLWHAHPSVKANTAGSAGGVTHPPLCSCRGVALARSSECCGYTHYERASSSAEYQSSVGVDWLCVLVWRRILVAVAVAKRLSTTGRPHGQFRGLTPVFKLEERRVGTDGDGMPSSAASPRDHRRLPQARPGRALRACPWGRGRRKKIC
eukprot:scaffold12410_cov56-Phaeocystis_antarctica.AAC.4